MSELSADLMDILVCPNCRAQLALDVERDELVCVGACGLAYPIKDGIPVLIVSEGRKPEKLVAAEPEPEKEEEPTPKPSPDDEPTIAAPGLTEDGGELTISFS
jgi:uncharacterized protein YbaR (Trm112 family)